MTTIDEVNKICTNMGLTKLSISKYPTWIDKQRQEGIELQIDKVIPFWNLAGERNYKEPTGEHIKKVIEAISNSQSDKSEQKVPEQKPETDISIIPDNFSVNLIEKWKKLSTVERMMMVQRTPKDQIFYKPVGDGKKAPYVTGNYMIKEANFAFLFDWHFSQTGISIGNEGVSVYGTLYALVDGREMSRPAVGYEEINKKMTAQLAIKSATTDAIKKGLSLFGFNSDVYSGEI